MSCLGPSREPAFVLQQEDNEGHSHSGSFRANPIFAVLQLGESADFLVSSRVECAGADAGESLPL